jgi:DNA-binding GntR family transcriptional regulator
MLEVLITSKTRIKLLVKFFLEPDSEAYLRQLAEEFGESTNSVRVELNRLTEAGLLISSQRANTVVYKANENFPLYHEIRSIVSKKVGIEAIVEDVLKRLKGVQTAYFKNTIFQASSEVMKIELLLVGENINEVVLHDLIHKAKILLNKEILVDLLTLEEFESMEEKDKGGFVLFWRS